jgi:hypothetical protein
VGQRFAANPPRSVISGDGRRTVAGDVLDCSVHLRPLRLRHVEDNGRRAVSLKVHDPRRRIIGTDHSTSSRRRQRSCSRGSILFRGGMAVLSDAAAQLVESSQRRITFLSIASCPGGLSWISLNPGLCLALNRLNNIFKVYKVIEHLSSRAPCPSAR